MQHNTSGILVQIVAHRSAFVFVFVALFAATFGFLSLVGATPDASATTAFNSPTTAETYFSAETAPAATSNSSAAGLQGDAAESDVAAFANSEQPVRVVAKEIGLDAVVQNPTSTDIDVLDQAALHGAVRYPTSAMLGEDGTVVLFGHSSYLPIVHNQVYKTFDDIQDLTEGSIVSVYSADLEYRYSVVGVEVANATRDVVELNPAGRHLTLVTCNSFATKQDRFVVTADFVGAYSLISN
ncbi:MAG: sortase [bacterium]|nr:sortase [bacterium]